MPWRRGRGGIQSAFKCRNLFFSRSSPLFFLLKKSSRRTRTRITDIHNHTHSMAPYVRSNAEHSPSRRRWCSSEGRTLRARSTSLEAYNGGGGGWCCGTASAKGSVRQIWRTAKRITALSSFKLLALLTLAPTAVHGGWEFTDLNETCSSACAKVKRVCTNNNRLAFANQCGSPKTITDALARSNLTSITCEPYQHWPTDTRGEW